MSFGSTLQTIFNGKCTDAGCHTGMKPAANMLLSAGKSYAALVGAPTDGCSGSKLRVKAGSPSESYLLNKLTGAGMCSGSVMPKTGGELSAAQIDQFRAWICNGAPNN